MGGSLCKSSIRFSVCMYSWEDIEMLRTYKVRKGSQPQQFDMSPCLGKGGTTSNELINLNYI